MPGWRDTPEKRRRDAETYGDPEYIRNRAAARRRAAGKCEECGHRHAKLQCDHVVPKSSGTVDNSLSNLRMLCTKEGGGCGCHESKTYAQRSPGGSRKADPEPRPPTQWLRQELSG